MQKYVKKEKRYRYINFICLLAVYKKLIGTGRVLGTRILRYVSVKKLYILKHFRNAQFYILLFLPHGWVDDIFLVIFYVRVQ